MLSSVSSSKVWSSDIDHLQDFGHQALVQKTPANTPRFDHDIPLFESQRDWKSWEKDILTGKPSLDLSGSQFSLVVEKQFKCLEMASNDVIKQVNLNNDNLSTSVRMLEFEKNHLKVEIGKREEDNVHDDFESLPIWWILSVISRSIKDAGNVKPTISSAHVLKENIEKILQGLNKGYSNQQGEINNLKFIVRILSDIVRALENNCAQECTPNVAERLDEVLPDVVDLDLSGDLKETMRELHDLKPSKRMVKF